jgi:hypothetical protein
MVVDNPSLGDALRRIKDTATLLISREDKRLTFTINSGPLGIVSEVKPCILPDPNHKSGVNFAVLGGSGWDLANSLWSSVQLVISEEALILSPVHGGPVTSIPIDTLMAIEAYGPGTTSTNAGLVGGGFGLEGAALGILAASVINAATTRTATNTFLRLATPCAELFLHTSEVEPTPLRMKLSPAVVRVEAKRLRILPALGLSAEIRALHALLQDGLITDAEFGAAKNKLLG